MQALPAIQEGENNLPEGYYARTYGRSRLERGFRLTSDCAALLEAAEIGDFNIVDPVNDSVQHISDTEWTVRSQRTRDTVYRVNRLSRRRFRCTCQDYQNGTLQCKHIRAVRLRAGRVFNTGVPNPLERYHQRYGARRYTRAYFPAGSSVRVGGAHAVTQLPPTGYTRIAFDQPNGDPDRNVALRLLTPARGDRTVQLLPTPSHAWYEQNCQ